MESADFAPQFRDRRHAGRELGALLAEIFEQDAKDEERVVLALPRGGVPVGYEVAQALNAPLHVWIVRKLGVPGHEELAMGAISSGGVVVTNEDVLKHVQDREKALADVLAKERRELARREAAYAIGDRSQESPVMIAGHCVILVDDGLATGATMEAAVQSLRKLEPSKIIVAVPVASDSAYARIQEVADAIVAYAIPREFWGVGRFYDDFSQTSDEEVIELLQQRNAEIAAVRL